MEKTKINFSVDDEIIANLLGTQNFSNCNAAILELVKNAYDAGAEKVNISIYENKICIIDNGKGMDKDVFLHKWMYVGKGNNKYKIVFNETKKERIISGAKGIGRFALARLGKDVTMVTRKPDANVGIKWHTTWSKESEYEQIDVLHIGTSLIIEKLNDKWTEKKVVDLAKYLGLVCNQSDMRIVLKWNDKKIPVIFYFDAPLIGTNFVQKINLSYNAIEQTLNVSIDSDEFDSSVKALCPNIDINHLEKTINIKDQLSRKNNLIQDIEEDKEKIITEIGSFCASLFFSIQRINLEDKSRFKYKYDTLSNRYTSKVCLYRNSFSISGYDGNTDWLNLDSRYRRSPAAASHESGSWKVRSNQLSGYVLIDKKENSKIKELSNRQAIEDDAYFAVFKQIIFWGLEIFESYRQDIIRNIVMLYGPLDVTEQKKIIEDVISGKVSLSEIAVTKDKEFVSAVKEMKETLNSQQERISSLQYDSRLLNTLSTIGLRAASIAHDLKNKKNNLDFVVDYIIDALKELDVWKVFDEYVNDFTLYVPAMLEEVRDVNKSTIKFLNVMLENTNKKRFSNPTKDFSNFMRILKKNWEYDYPRLSIKYSLPDVNEFKLSEDIFEVIFDNLLLNSVQQNNQKISVDITITYDKYIHKLIISYSDNGIGLARTYHNNPFKILDVHETTRVDGHGIGMWIVNSTILSNRGEVKKISIPPGFSLLFTLGV